MRRTLRIQIGVAVRQPTDDDGGGGGGGWLDRMAARRRKPPKPVGRDRKRQTGRECLAKPAVDPRNAVARRVALAAQIPPRLFVYPSPVPCRALLVPLGGGAPPWPPFHCHLVFNNRTKPKHCARRQNAYMLSQQRLIKYTPTREGRFLQSLHCGCWSRLRILEVHKNVLVCV